MTNQTIVAQIGMVRRDNLRKLIHQHDGPSALARKLGYKNAAFLVTMAGPNPTREVTETSARKIEAKLGLPPHSLDAAAIGRAKPSLQANFANGCGRTAPMNADLMHEVIVRVGEYLEAVPVKLSAAKFADVVLFIYIDAAERGSLSDEAIQRTVQLAK